MSVISAEQFKSKATRIVEISGFEENEKIEVRIKSMSLLTMMNNGKIPNELLGVVQKLFNEGANSKKKKISEKDVLSQSDDIKSLTMLMDVACKEVLVEPKFEEIEDYLTDVQKTEIFNAAQGPIKQVTPFIQK